jgi:MFS family permease
MPPLIVMAGRLSINRTSLLPRWLAGDDELRGLQSMSSNNAVLPVAWYRSLNATQWKTLIAANLGWTFDGFEFFALFLTVGFALHQLLDAVQYTAIPRYAGYVVAATAFGWAIGGVIGGIIADYIGRKRTMILAIFAYSLTTGLSAIAWNWQAFAILRFLVGVGIGSEWVTGASIVSELWPDHSRGKGGGMLQCCAALGGICASGVWLVIGGSGDAVDPLRHPRVATLGTSERAPCRSPRPAPPWRPIGR